MKKLHIKKLDKKWSEKIRSKGKCEICGKTNYLNAHHFYSRSNMSTRWDINNGFCLCSGHHTLSINSAHKSPTDFVEWVIKTRGAKRYKELRKRKNKIVKLKYEDVLSSLSEESK